MARKLLGRLEAVDLSGFHQRLSAVLGEESATSFAAKAGVSKSGLTRVLNGGLPSLDFLIAIASAAGVSLDWLVTGASALEGFVAVPRIDIKASAGAGSVGDTEPLELLGSVAFREDWLRRIGIHPRHAQALTAVGDSMEPTIRDGDLLLVDRSIAEVRNDGIYIVVIRGMVVVKRVQIRRDGAVILRSDNRTLYDEEVVPPDEVHDLIIEGRVRWFGRTI